MARYTIKTTVDITRSNPDREDTDQIRQGQQSNFNTLLQGIGMRSNVDWNRDPIRVLEDDVAYWYWTFEVERADTFLDGDDPTGLLKQDLHGIPVLRNLTETANLTTPAFITKNGESNIWISEE